VKQVSRRGRGVSIHEKRDGVGSVWRAGRMEAYGVADWHFSWGRRALPRTLGAVELSTPGLTLTLAPSTALRPVATVVSNHPLALGRRRPLGLGPGGEPNA
jgi:hypothetical protein